MASGQHVGQPSFTFSLVALWRTVCREAEGQTQGEDFGSHCNPMAQGSANSFFGQSQIVSILGFTGHMVSVTTTQVCHCRMKAEAIISK